MVCQIKKLIKNQLRLNLLPADMIFVQTSSDAFESPEYVDSGHGLRLRADSTYFKPLQGTFKNEILD